MNIAAYCRVSTEKEEQLDSLRHQKEFFTGYAQKNGHTLVEIYADEGISGTSLKRREAFHRLLRDAAAGRFEMVVVKDISRFARNTVDSLQSIRTLKAMGIRTLFLTANMDSMGDSEFILTLFAAMAQEESSNLSKRVKWGKRINAEKGRVPRQLFGYDRIDNFTLAIHPEEADTVRRIFTLYARQGLGCRSISRLLNEEGRKTKQGGSWDPRGIRRVLKNPIYCGILVNHKYEITDFLTGKQIALPQEEQFFHTRPQWAIISGELFQAAQEAMAARQRPEPEKPFREGRYSSRYPFSTLIRCACCGRSFTRKSYTYKNTRVYWRCVTNDQYPGERCENRTCLEEGALLEALGAHIRAMAGSPECFLAEALTLWDRASPPEPQEKELSGKRQRLLSRAERYRELYAEGLLSLDSLKEKLQAAETALQRLTEEAACREAPAGDRQAQILALFSPETYTNREMRQLLDHISVDQEGKVRIVFRKWDPGPAK